MMMKNIFLLILVFIGMSVSAQDYNVALIPDSLLKHADVVQRTDEIKIIIHSLKSATIQHRHAYTIFNE